MWIQTRGVVGIVQRVGTDQGPEKLHLTQVFSPRLKKNTQNLEINQILGVVVQEKESNMVFCSRWKFPTLGMTVLSGTSAEPRFRSARSSLGLETSI